MVLVKSRIYKNDIKHKIEILEGIKEIFNAWLEKEDIQTICKKKRIN